ncbi:MAG: prolyl oligopeptidase family serine peptidase [Actinomycetota bacterium]
MDTTTNWRRRLTTPTVGEVSWSATSPHRLAIVSTESGASQAWSWDLDTGERRQASSGGVGAEEAHITPDGTGVVWWLDPEGDERGRWMVTPFEPGEVGGAFPLFPELPDMWMSGLSLVTGSTAAGFSDDESYRVVVRHGAGPVSELYSHVQPAGVGQDWLQGPGGLSADGSLIAIWHAEGSNIENPAVRVLDAHTGETVGEVADEGMAVVAAGWSPIPGDDRLVVLREIEGFARPYLWSPRDGDPTPLDLDLPGAVTLADWFPDATALLLHHDHLAVHGLVRLDLIGGDLTQVAGASGTIDGAGVRPDGAVWFHHESGVRPPSWRDASTEAKVLAIAEAPPEGRPWAPVWFENPAGQRIQGWFLRPDGKPPYPAVVSVHGGPNYHNTDAFEPRSQAFADEGYAVLLVNYRGSTGYGRRFRQALYGNVGFPESEDINAGLDHVIAGGLVDAGHVFIEGWSWGGYLATLNAGLHPDRWRGVIAGIPVGDSVAAHYESAPSLQAWDVAVMGGTPMEVPELFHERNPMTYVDRVKAPMLIIAGEHDSRCPLGQIMTYAHALRVRGHEVDVHLYPGGHHANDVAERIRHIDLMLEFMHRHQ